MFGDGPPEPAHILVLERFSHGVCAGCVLHGLTLAQCIFKIEPGAPHGVSYGTLAWFTSITPEDVAIPGILVLVLHVCGFLPVKYRVVVHYIRLKLCWIGLYSGFVNSKCNSQGVMIRTWREVLFRIHSSL